MRARFIGARLLRRAPVAIFDESENIDDPRPIVTIKPGVPPYLVEIEVHVTDLARVVILNGENDGPPRAAA